MSIPIRRRAISTSPISSSRAGRRKRSSPSWCRRSSATFPGRNRCAGARRRGRRARYGSIEGRGGETLRWVRPLQSIVCTFGPGDRGAGGGRFRGRRHPLRQRHLRPPLPRAGRDHGAPLRRLCGQAGGGEGRHRRRPPQGDHPGRREEPRLRQRARPGRGRGPAGGGVRAGRMAGRADGRIRGRISWPSRPRSSG